MSNWNQPTEVTDVDTEDQAKIERAANMIQKCIFIGDQLGPWMADIPKEKMIEQWCLTLAEITLDVAENG